MRNCFPPPPLILSCVCIYEAATHSVCLLCCVSTWCWGQRSCVHPCCAVLHSQCCPTLLSLLATLGHCCFPPPPPPAPFPLAVPVPQWLCLFVLFFIFFLISCLGISICLCGSSSTKASRGLFVFYFQPTLKNNSFVS